MDTHAGKCIYVLFEFWPWPVHACIWLAPWPACILAQAQLAIRAVAKEAEDPDKYLAQLAEEEDEDKPKGGRKAKTKASEMAKAKAESRGRGAGRGRGRGRSSKAKEANTSEAPEAPPQQQKARIQVHLHHQQRLTSQHRQLRLQAQQRKRAQNSAELHPGSICFYHLAKTKRFRQMRSSAKQEIRPVNRPWRLEILISHPGNLERKGLLKTPLTKNQPPQHQRRNVQRKLRRQNSRSKPRTLCS